MCHLLQFNRGRMSALYTFASVTMLLFLEVVAIGDMLHP
jgi:hypothetical protein